MPWALHVIVKLDEVEWGEHGSQILDQSLHFFILLLDSPVKEHDLFLLSDPGLLGRNLVPQLLSLLDGQTIFLGSLEDLSDLLNFVDCLDEVDVVPLSLPSSSLALIM